MKKTSGFTLVELIVVIAILGILAGIAIPVYSGYIAKAREAADLQQLDAVKTAVFARYLEHPEDFSDGSSLNPYEYTISEIRYNVAEHTVQVDSGSDGSEDEASIVLDDTELGIDISDYFNTGDSHIQYSWKWTPAAGWEKIDS